MTAIEMVHFITHPKRYKILKVLLEKYDEYMCGTFPPDAHLSYKEVAKKANIPDYEASYFLSQLCDNEIIGSNLEKRTSGNATIAIRCYYLIPSNTVWLKRLVKAIQTM